MIPIALSLENFGPFTTRENFIFPTRPGLYFMRGDNQDEPRLEGNGAGKSTVWKALTWLLFGKTPSGMKAGDIANWTVGKKTSVSLLVEVGSLPLSWHITRTWSPNSWTLKYDGDSEVIDLTKDPTNQVLAELRLNFTAFTQTVVMPQDQPLFLDLKADAQAALFSDLMQLDKWLRSSENASARAKVEDLNCRVLERELSSIEGQLKATQDTTISKQHAEWEEYRSRRISTLYTTHDNLSTAVLQQAAMTEAWKARVPDAEKRVIWARNKASENHSESGECPACGQSLPHSDTAAVDDYLKLVISDLEDLFREIRSSDNQLLSIERQLDQVEAEGIALEKQENPFQKLLNNRQSLCAELSNSLRTATLKLDTVQERYSMASRWVRWFKEIRLTQIGESLEQLEIEVNNQVTALGLIGWEMRFNVDKETKSGSIQRGFSVFVQSPHNSRPVPLESWSGGEHQRLLVASQMGLANLSRSRTETPFALEVWDEPTKGMAQQGVQDLLEALKTRAEQERRPIWIVDHNTLGFNGFSGQVCVVKKDGRSRFEWV